MGWCWQSNDGSGGAGEALRLGLEACVLRAWRQVKLCNQNVASRLLIVST